jgi:PhnB protein
MFMSNAAPIPHLCGQRGRGGDRTLRTDFGALPDGKHPAEDGKRLMHAHLKLVGGAIFFA